MAIFKEQLFVIILTFFAIWTGLVGVVNLAGTGDITLDNWGAISGGTISGQISPDLSSSMSASSAQLTGQDYTNSAGYNSNISKTGFDAFGDGTWNQIDGTGYVVQSLGLLTGDATLTIDGVQGSNNVYTVSYFINNPTGADFSIYPRSVMAGHNKETSTTLELDFRSDGLHYKNQWNPPIIDPGDAFYLPYPGLSTLTGSEIKVVLDENNRILTVYKDGIMLCSISGIRQVSGADQGFGIYYGTVQTKKIGFIVQKINTKISYTAGAGSYTSTGIWFIDAIIGTFDAIKQAANTLAQFGLLIAKIVGLSTSPVIPFWAWAPIGLPLIAVLIYMALQLWRGTS